CQFIGGAYGRLSGHVGSIKRKMRDAHDDAHREIEATLKANRGQPVGVGPIVTKYRTLITGYSTELRGFVADEITMLDNKFSLGPPPSAAANGGRGRPDPGGSPSDVDDQTPADNEPVRGRHPSVGRDGSLDPAPEHDPLSPVLRGRFDTPGSSG